MFQQDVFESEIQTVSEYMGGALAGKYLGDGPDSGADSWGRVAGNSSPREIKNLKRMLLRSRKADELPPEMDVIGWLMEAVRVGDPWRAYMILIDSSWEHDLIRLADMPPAQFAELFECLDPLRVHERVDVLANLRFSAAMRGYGFADHLIDVYGVRRMYGTLLDILGPIVEDRVEARKLATPPAVFATLYRLAGAASMPRLAYPILDLAGNASELWSDRRLDAFSSGDIMLDYLRTKFLTESVYYQHDKTRVRVRPRNFSPWGCIRSDQRRRLEVLHIQDRQNKSHRFGLDPEDDLYDLQRWLADRHRMEKSLPASRLRVCGPSEDMACAALIGSAVGGYSESVRRLLFMFWGIRVTSSTVKGGDAISPDAALRPTGKVLKAVARALGALNEINMGIRVISHMSSHFEIPVPREVWSELLEFAHVHGAHPALTEWSILEDPRQIETSVEIPPLVEVLRKKHGFTLGFRDHIILATNLIGAGRVDEALRPLRDASALYEETRVKAETAAVAAAAARAQKVSMPSYVSRDMAFRHLTMEREVRRHELMTACRDWLRKAGRLLRPEGCEPEKLPHELARPLRPLGSKRPAPVHRLFEEIIPSFVLEFYDLVPQRIEYETPTGFIMLHHPVPRVELRKEWTVAPDATRWKAFKLAAEKKDMSATPQDYGVREDEEGDTDENSSAEEYREYYGVGEEDTDAHEAGERDEWAKDMESGAGAEDAEALGVEESSEDVDDLIARITGADPQETENEPSAESAVAADGTGSAETDSTGVPEETEEETYVDRLLSRKAGGYRADMDHILEQNMGRSYDAEAEAETEDSAEEARHMTDEEREYWEYQRHANEGRDVDWSWWQEEVIIRQHQQVNVRTPIRPRLGPRGWVKWDLEGRVVFAWKGEVRFRDLGTPAELRARAKARGMKLKQREAAARHLDEVVAREKKAAPVEPEPDVDVSEEWQAFEDLGPPRPRRTRGEGSDDWKAFHGRLTEPLMEKVEKKRMKSVKESDEWKQFEAAFGKTGEGA